MATPIGWTYGPWRTQQTSATPYATVPQAAEVLPGAGIIGAAAQARIPIRISHATAEFGYGRAMREDAQRRGLTVGLRNHTPCTRPRI